MPVVISLVLLLPTAFAWSAHPSPEGTRFPAVRPTRTPRPTPTATPRPLPAFANVPILMYHYVDSAAPAIDRLRRELTVPVELFDAQMAYLRDNGYTTISLGQLHANLSTGEPLPPNPVALTFDDGYLDAYTQAFPILKKYGHTATFFVVTDFINYKNPEHITWDMAREMDAAGMSIESHSRTHIDLRRRSNALLVWELLGPVEQIEAFIGKRPRFFRILPAGTMPRS